ncbi:hypothetical protein Barb6_02898 [Bacteroidales bacterium Barb6]|nr:hypothetical protein Barb6_02898 [Bacteroidales bacterium Barb6]
MEESLSQAEEKIKTLIKSDETLSEQHRRLCTVEGIGDKTAVKMIVATEGFTDFMDARKSCCHAGVAPFSIFVRQQHSVAKQGLATGGQEYQSSFAYGGFGCPPHGARGNCMSIMKGKSLKERMRSLS